MNFNYVKCSEIMDVRDGTHDSPKYVLDGYPLVTSKNIKDNKIDFQNVNFISEEDFHKINLRSEVENGDILMPMIGTIGNPVLVNTEEKFAIKNVALFKLSNNKEIESKYFYYLLTSHLVKRQLENNKRGGTQNFVSLGNIRDLSIPVISLEKQNFIIKILDKAQELINKRKAQIEALDELVKSRFIEMFGDVVSNPKGWDAVKLGKISSVGSSKRVFVEELVNEGIPFYRGTEIGALSIGENIEPTLFITKEHYENLKECTGVPTIGDLLMPSICPDGRIWCVDTEMPFYFKDGRVLWIHLESNIIDSIYLKHMLREKFNRDYNKIASGTTFAELKIFALKDLDIIMPPIDLQNQFADFVKQINKLKFEMQNSLKELENNFNSLIQKAFNGELFN